MKIEPICSTSSKETWRCGFIRPDRSDKTLTFEIRNLKDLLEKVLPHFRDHPLRSRKQSDVIRFAEICELIRCGMHLKREGFKRIVAIATEMNPPGRRKYSGSDILDSLRTGERIVYASGNRGRS